MSKKVSSSGPFLMGIATLCEVGERAAKYVLEGGRALQIAHSQIHDDSEVFGQDDRGKLQEPGAKGKLVVKNRWAQDKGFLR